MTKGRTNIVWYLIFGAVLLYFAVTFLVLSMGRARRELGAPDIIRGDDLLGGTVQPALGNHNLESLFLEGLPPLQKPRPLNYNLLGEDQSAGAAAPAQGTPPTNNKHSLRGA